MANVYNTTIELTGQVDPSVAKAIGLSVKELAKINAAYNTINKLQKQANLAANGLPPVLQKTTVEIAKASRKAEELANSFKRVQEVAAGVFEGEFFLGALEKGLDIVKEIGSSIKEFGISSLDVRGKREVLQNQQRSMLESLGRGGQFGELDMMMRNMEGRETMIKYSQLMASTNRLESSAPGRFDSVEKVHSMLAKLSDVSKDPATFDLATQAFTRILAAGKLDAKHIQELGFDTGYSFGPAIAKALNMSPEQMTDAMKKHKISGSQGIDALFKAFDIITGPGGAAYKHAEAQLKGWQGVVARWEGHMEDFKESFGKQLENFFSPIAEEIFKYLTPAALTHAFDGLEQFSKHMGQVSADLFSGVFIPLETKLPLFFSRIKDPLQGFSDWVDSFFVEVNDPVSGLHSVLKADGFNGMNKMLDEIAKFATSPSTQIIANFGWSSLQQGLRDMFTGLEEIADLMSDIVSGNWGKLGSDLKKYEYDKPEHDNLIESIIPGRAGYTNWGQSAGGVPTVVINGKTYSDEDNQLYYEHLSEGRSSQQGPHKNVLGVGYGIGIGKSKQASTGAYYGKWVKVHLPNGSTIIRQVNETSARNHGIELESPTGDESSYGNGKATIEGVYNTKEDAEKSGSSSSKRIRSTSTTPIVINNTWQISGDANHILSTIKENHHAVARHLHDAISEKLGLRAVV
jgi:hypothetical protein